MRLSFVVINLELSVDDHFNGKIVITTHFRDLTIDDQSAKIDH